MDTIIIQIKSNIMNIAGVLVMSLVGASSIFFLYGSEYWVLIALLSIAMPILFILFIRGTSYSTMLVIFWVESAIIATLYYLVPTSFIAILGIVWIVQAAEIFSTKTSAWLLFISILVFTSSQLLHSNGENTFEVLLSAASFGLFQVFALGAIQRAISERQLREETGALNRELLATRDLLSQTTAQRERVRIARDLHDILGHHMTALILNLEVANHIAKDEAQEKVEQSLSLAKLLLGDIRTAVSELRDDDTIDLEASITKMVNGVPDLEIDIDFHNAPQVKSVEIADSLLRCAQEAITNVLRHSRASQCKISLSKAKESYQLTVSDNGSFINSIKIGNGIKGMTERIENLGGQLTWDNTSQGFSLIAELPMGKPQ